MKSSHNSIYYVYFPFFLLIFLLVYILLATKELSDVETKNSNDVEIGSNQSNPRTDSEKAAISGSGNSDNFSSAYTERLSHRLQNGILYELLSTQPVWSGEQSDYLKPGRLPPNHTILKASNIQTSVTYWSIPVTADHLELFDENVVLINLGREAAVTLVDAETGGIHLYIELTDIPVTKSQGDFYRDWEEFFNHSFDPETGELYLLGWVLKIDRYEYHAINEREYYVVKFEIPTVHEWLKNRNGAQYSGYSNFLWETLVGYPYYADILAGDDFVIASSEYVDFQIDGDWFDPRYVASADKK